VDIETKHRSHQNGPHLREGARLTRSFPPRREHRVGLAPMTEEAQLLSIRLLREVAGSAGSFQRSVVGHLDHGDWLNRVRTDGQRLIDLLSEMGFNPSPERIAADPKPAL
jgi:hypothetical protein